MPGKTAMRETVNRLLMEDSSYRRLACDAVDVLQKGPKLFGTFGEGDGFAIPFMDIYCQTHRLESLRYEDLVMAAFAWQRVLSGDLMYRFLQAPTEPLADADSDGNRAILRDMVRVYSADDPDSLVYADFFGGTWGEDGYLVFAKPPITHFEGFATDDGVVPDEPPRPPRSGRHTRFPLEVGYCVPDQMHFHLSQDGCVARFPYGHRFIVLLEPVGEW